MFWFISDGYHSTFSISEVIPNASVSTCRIVFTQPMSLKTCVLKSIHSIYFISFCCSRTYIKMSLITTIAFCYHWHWTNLYKWSICYFGAALCRFILELHICMTEACVIEIRTFNLQIKQMDLKSLLQTNVDNLHSDAINGYIRHKDDRTSIHLAYTADKICGCD